MADPEKKEKFLGLLGGIYTHQTRVSSPTPEALDIVARGEQELDDIAAEHRRQQFMHTDRYYEFRDSDPDRAEFHHELKYKHMGEAALIERARLGVRWGSRPTWISAEVVDMMGVKAMEDDLEARLVREATAERLRRENTLASQNFQARGVPGIPDMAEADMYSIDDGFPPITPPFGGAGMRQDDAA